MNKVNPAVVIGLVVVALGALAFVIFRGIGPSENDTKGLIPPPRAGAPTFEPQAVTSRGMPAADTTPSKATSKIKNITPPGDSR